MVEHDVSIRNGLPRFSGGERGLIRSPWGCYTLVNGVTSADGKRPKALPDKLLRSAQVAA